MHLRELSVSANKTPQNHGTLEIREELVFYSVPKGGEVHAINPSPEASALKRVKIGLTHDSSEKVFIEHRYIDLPVANIIGETSII